MAQYVEFSGICKAFPGVQALSDINFRIEGGKVTALIGENGAGKSTLLKVLNGEIRPDIGTVTINGKQVAFKDLSLCKYVSAGGKYYMAQPGSVMYTISVEQNNAPTVKIGSSFSGAVTVVK